MQDELRPDQARQRTPCRDFFERRIQGRSAVGCRRVRGLVVMIVACQVIDPGSIPGERSPFDRGANFERGVQLVLRSRFVRVFLAQGQRQSCIVFPVSFKFHRMRQEEACSKHEPCRTANDRPAKSRGLDPRCEPKVSLDPRMENLFSVRWGSNLRRKMCVRWGPNPRQQS